QGRRLEISRRGEEQLQGVQLALRVLPHAGARGQLRLRARGRLGAIHQADDAARADACAAGRIYSKRRMRRGRPQIKQQDAEKASEFAVYDSKIRKKDLYDR